MSETPLSAVPLKPSLPARDHGASEALGLWEPKRSLTLEAARRHTQMIVRLRKVLMALTGLMVIVLGVQFMGNSAATFDSPSATESVKMVGPRYSGRTADGLPFYLTADTATRTLARRDEVSLINPVLEFIRADGAASSFVMAKIGTFDDINKELSLSGAVSLETDDGYSCKTTQAQIFAREKRIEGSEIISCSGAFGEVEGQAFEINNSYTEFVFKDGVGGTLYQDPAQRADIDTSVPDRQNAFAFRGDDPIIVSANRAVYLRGTTDLYGTKRDETGSTTETISSDELTAPVVIKQGDAIITANQIQILRREATSETDGTLRLGEVNKIIASGKFRYVTPETDVSGDQGIYERDKSLITVTGNVRVTQPGGNVALTDRLIYNTTLETVRFSGQCQGQNCDGGGRTRFTLNSTR